MKKLIGEAQVHLLYTAQPTGLKLKLLNVLFAGRFVICNEHMVAGTGLRENDSMKVVSTPEQFRQTLAQLMDTEFNGYIAGQRKTSLASFDNTTNTQNLLTEIFVPDSQE